MEGRSFTAAYEFGAQFNPFFFWPKLRLSTGIAKKKTQPTDSGEPSNLKLN